MSKYMLMKQGTIFEDWTPVQEGNNLSKLLKERDKLIKLNVPKYFSDYKVFELIEKHNKDE